MFVKNVFIGVFFIFPIQVMAMNTDKQTGPVLSASQAHVRCPICQKDFNADQVLQLQCSHAFCYDCLFSQLRLAIRKKSTKPLKCLNKACKHKFLSTEIELIEHRGQHDTPDMVSSAEDERIVRCPTPDCTQTMIFNQGMGTFPTRRHVLNVIISFSAQTVVWPGKIIFYINAFCPADRKVSDD